MLVSDLVEKLIACRKRRLVLILVLVDVGLGLRWGNAVIAHEDGVLILVLVDVGLGRSPTLI